ncbi:MAG: SURF1 family protein [Rubrivivax sp.]
MTALPARRRRWLVLLAAVLGVALTARLGLWQLDRAAQKIALQRSQEQRSRLPALGAADLSGKAEADAALWQRTVAVEGRWMAGATVYLENRAMNGHAGFFVVTPLVLDDGRAVAVQRGWLPRDIADRTRIAPYRSADGRLRVRGRIAPEVSRLYELGAAASGALRQNLDLAAYAGEIRRPLLPLVIVQEDGGDADGLLRQWPPPAVDVYKNYGYAFQWFGLSGLIAFLYVWFQVIRPRRRAAA